MTKYRKKPIVIEAVRWNGKNEREMFEFLELNSSEKFIVSDGKHFYIDHNKVKGGLIIKTSEGDMRANKGDYIIKEPFDKERKFYPCKPDIFEATYEPVDEKDLIRESILIMNDPPYS